MTIPIDSIAPVGQVMEAAKKPVESPAMDQLTQKFEEMMETGGDGVVPKFNEANEVTGLSQVLDKQDKLMKHALSEVDSLAESAHSMSPTEFAAESIRVGELVIQTQFNLSMATSMTSGVTQGFRSLLKNQ